MGVSPKPPKITNVESLSISEDGDGNGENDEKGLLMNPMEDFAAKQEIGTMGFEGENDYKRGLYTIGFITFLFATNSPVLHWAFTTGDNPPPVLLVNAAVSVVALVGLLLGGDTLEDTGTLPTDSDSNSRSQNNPNANWFGGLELGLWKFMGTTSNLAGLALTTAGHGALLIQLTTLIVPITRALVYKESVSTKLKLSIGLALSGVLCFANDPTGTPSLLGDGLCVVAAVCYSAYDLRLYEYGKMVDAVKPLITTKIATQAILSIGLLFLAPASPVSGGSIASSSWQESSDYLQALVASSEWIPVAAAVIWSGVAVNAVAPFLQVGGQQIVGPTKCQTIYASQPLWAAILSFVFLGERLGLSGVVGGTSFLVALALAATAESATTTTITEDTENNSATIRWTEPTVQTTIKDATSNANSTGIEFDADVRSYRDGEDSGRITQ
jgi:drug/metabolite transporter (DMT)-like permease